ncbi:hypothetical protein DL768_007204 [Monosporascus sp. mg162]|nr:hypothetical protein DL768_007204 [Monosporascus sp. mg162]
MLLNQPLTFQDWYSTYGADFMKLSTGTCNITLANYVASPFDPLLCGAHVNCILEATTEARKAHMASAAIFLGMVPTLLSLVAPSIPQLALLSARRPLLALFISSGSTVLFLDRLFRIESPRETLTRTGGERFIPRLKRQWAILFSVGEYLLVTVAAINVIWNSWQLGNKAVVVWKCELNFMPLIWVLGPPFILMVVAIPFHFTTIAKSLRAQACDYSPLAVPEQVDSKRKPSTVGELIAREITPAIRHPTIKLEEIPHPETWAVIILNVGFCLAALQVLLGMGVLSSVLFVSVRDAMWVGLRYVVSTGICRLVLALELECMKSDRRSDN